MNNDIRLRGSNKVSASDSQGSHIDKRPKSSFRDILKCLCFKQNDQDKFEELYREVFGVAQIESEMYQSQYFIQNSE